MLQFLPNIDMFSNTGEINCSIIIMIMSSLHPHRYYPVSFSLLTQIQIYRHH